MYYMILYIYIYITHDIYYTRSIKVQTQYIYIYITHDPNATSVNATSADIISMIMITLV